MFKVIIGTCIQDFYFREIGKKILLDLDREIKS